MSSNANKLNDVFLFSGFDIVTRRKTETSERRISTSSNGFTLISLSHLTVPLNALDDRDASAIGPGTVADKVLTHGVLDLFP